MQYYTETNIELFILFGRQIGLISRNLVARDRDKFECLIQNIS